MCRPEPTPWTETWAAVYGRWIGHPMCPVEVRASGLRGAGYGVFARHSIPSGAFVTPFDGRLVPAHTRVTSKTWDYEYQMAHGAHIVPALTARFGRGLGHLLNDAIHPDVTGVVNNCEFYERARAMLWIRTRRDVSAGEELLVPYGFQYWCARGGDPRLTPAVREWCMVQGAASQLLASSCAIVEEYLGRDVIGRYATYRIRRHATGHTSNPTCRCDRAQSTSVRIDGLMTVRCGACSSPYSATAALGEPVTSDALTALTDAVEPVTAAATPGSP